MYTANYAAHGYANCTFSAFPLPLLRVQTSFLFRFFLFSLLFSHPSSLFEDKNMLDVSCNRLCGLLRRLRRENFSSSLWRNDVRYSRFGEQDCGCLTRRVTLRHFEFANRETPCWHSFAFHVRMNLTSTFHSNTPSRAPYPPSFV